MQRSGTERFCTKWTFRFVTFSNCRIYCTGGNENRIKYLVRLSQKQTRTKA
jgi:hypothetical protein